MTTIRVAAAICGGLKLTHIMRIIYKSKQQCTRDGLMSLQWNKHDALFFSSNKAVIERIDSS